MPTPIPSPAPGASPGPSPRPLPVQGAAPPSFPLVGTHFGVAFLWALLGAALLVPLAGQLAGGNFLDPRVLGLTHLFTLGWFTTVVTGVLYQIVPALMGVGARSLRVAWWSLGAHSLGTAILVQGLWSGQRAAMGLGYLLLFAGVFGHGWNLLPARRRATRNQQVGLYISYAHIGLGNAMLVAGARIGDAFGWWTTPRLPLIAAHLVFALVGFGTVTAFGVGSRMIPMFFNAMDRSDGTSTWLRRLLAGGTVVFAVGAMGGVPFVTWAGALLMAAATASFAWTAFRWFLGRGARRLDPTTSLVLASLVWLAVATGLGLGAVASGLRQPGLLTGFVATMLIGWLTGLTVAVSFRILSTLTWHHRFASRMGRPGTPQLGDLVHKPLAWTAGACHTAGMATFLGALLAGNRPLATAGAALLLAAFLATAAYHARLFLVRPAS